MMQLQYVMRSFELDPREVWSVLSKATQVGHIVVRDALIAFCIVFELDPRFHSRFGDVA